MVRRDRLVLRAFAVWTVWVWGTRLWNIWQDAERDLPFKVVHSVLAGVSVVFAVATWRIVARAASRRVTSEASAG